MSINKAYEQYKKIDLQTAPQSRLVVMMYEGAIKFLDKALDALDKKHGTEDAHKNILKAQEVICELLVSLNYDAGEIADRLAAIYTYMSQKLTEGNISKKKAPIVEVLKYLKELKMAWESAENSHSKQQTTTTTNQANSNIDVKQFNTEKATDNTKQLVESENRASPVITENKVDVANNKLKKYSNIGKNTSSSGKLNISG